MVAVDWQSGDAVHVAPSKFQHTLQPTSTQFINNSSHTTISHCSRQKVSDVSIAMTGKPLWLSSSSVHPSRHPPLPSVPSDDGCRYLPSPPVFPVGWYTCTTLHRHTNANGTMAPSQLCQPPMVSPWLIFLLPQVAFSRCRQVVKWHHDTSKCVLPHPLSSVYIGLCLYLCETHFLFFNVSAVVGRRSIFDIV